MADIITKFWQSKTGGSVLSKDIVIEEAPSDRATCEEVLLLFVSLFYLLPFLCDFFFFLQCCLGIEKGSLRTRLHKKEQGYAKIMDFTIYLHCGCLNKSLWFRTYNWNTNQSYQRLSCYPMLKTIFDNALINVGDTYGVFVSKDPSKKETRRRVLAAQKSAEVFGIQNTTTEITEKIVGMNSFLFFTF